MMDDTMQTFGDSPWLVLTLIGVFAACGSPDKSAEPGSRPSNGGGDTSWQVDPPPGPDASSPDGDGPDDAGPSDDGASEEAHSTTFRIVNRTESTMRVQSHDNCDGRGPGWVSFPDFRPARMTEDCTVCRCDTLDSGTPCAACAKACRRPRVKTIEPGEKLEWTWSGHLYRQNRDRGRACYRQQVPSRETYRAEFCWSKQAGPTGQNETLVDLECETTAFGYGDDEVVTQTITSSPDPEPAPQETTFELVNNGNQAIHLNPRSGCRPNDAEWLSVSSAGDGEAYRLASDCTVCTCEDAQNGSCAVCKRRCPPREPTSPELTIQPGETHTWTWSGHIYRNDQVGGRMCHRETVPSTDELEASLCWFEGQKSNPKQNCTSVDFTYGEDATVRHEVEPQARPQETTVRLVNTLDEPIRIERGQAPCNPGPDWFSIRDQQRELKLSTSCRTCSCRTAQNGTCGVCAVRCAPGTPIERIPSGQSVEWTWPGWSYEHASVNNQSCVARRVPRSKTHKVRMCWNDKDGPVGSGHKLGSTTCETVPLEYGGDEIVVHEVTSNGSP